ncbi:MAG: hypothetical protein QM809_04475 [Gordonia sp. (in: high G+C Gram-positive bacteria)]|uniref:GAP1-N2 domain-containing protein n=1 Tax=Gordonia sp. (in: high G+C Gram-positive bacteria) TaxID=84139 RepID=UPI0039E2E372
MAELQRSTAPTTAPADGPAQLLYTSFDNRASGNSGGWQVKQTVGELTPAEQDTLVARVSTTFDLEPRLPDFPSREQIDERPARLSYLRTPEGAGAYWHSVDAGKDGSGRPGNVFTHALLERGAAGHRPIEYWRSPGWLTPYGAADVAAATLTENTPPPVNPAVGAAAALTFLTGAFHRLTVFRALIDAILDRLLTGGPQVLLATRDHDQAALWIAAVSHLLPPETAARLSWSSHDHPRTAVTSGLDLVAIPAGSSVEKLPGKFVVVDEDAQPTLGQTGGRHTLSGGDRVPATVYSDLLEGVLSDLPLAVRVHDSLDRIDAEFPGEAVDPAWVLAVAIRNEPDLAEYAPTVQQVIAEDYPVTVNRVPWAVDLVRRAQVHYPPTIDAAHHRLVSAVERKAPLEDAAAQFTTALFQGDTWLAFPLDRIPRVEAVDPAEIGDGLSVAIARTRAGLEKDPSGALPYALRLGQILYALGRRGRGYDTMTAALDDALVLARPDLLWDLPNWPARTAFDQISQPVLHRYLRPLLIQAEPARLAALEPETWLRLCRQDSRALNLTSTPPTDAELYTAPFAVAAILRDQNSNDPDMRRQLAARGIDAALDSRQLPTADARRLVRELLTLAPPGADKLAEWFHRGSDRFDSGALIAGLLTGPADPRLVISLMSSATDADDDRVHAVADAARLRYWSAPQSPVPAEADDLVQAVRRISAAVDLAALPLITEVEPLIQSALIIARGDDQTWARRDTELSRRIDHDMTHRTTETATYLADLIAHDCLPAAWVAGRSFAAFALGRHAALPPSYDVQVVDQAVDLLVQRGGYRGPKNPTDLRDAAWAEVRRHPAPEAETFFQQYKKTADDWVRTHRIEGDAFRGWPLVGR